MKVQLKCDGCREYAHKEDLEECLACGNKFCTNCLPIGNLRCKECMEGYLKTFEED